MATFYTDKNSNYYVDKYNNYYIAQYEHVKTIKSQAFIYINGAFKRVKPIIIKEHNLGPIPNGAILTNTGVPFLTKDMQYVITTSDNTNITFTNTVILTDGEGNMLHNENKETLTALVNDYIYREYKRYVPHIIK